MVQRHNPELEKLEERLIVKVYNHLLGTLGNVVDGDEVIALAILAIALAITEKGRKPNG